MLTHLSFTLLALALSVVASFVWVRYWRRRLKLPEPFDSLVDLRSPDGAIVRVGRMLPATAPVPLPPVVMCHGLAMSRFAFAFDRETSLAGALSRLGRDVWILELRGAARADFHDRFGGSSFDTYAELDIPTALDHVLRETGAREVDWVGFSMGGMLAYAHLGAQQGGRIRRLVTIGSPMRLNLGVVFEPVHIATAVGALVLTRTPFDFYASFVAPLMGPWVPHALTPGLRASHYSARRLRRVMANAMADAPSGVTRQFARWIRSSSIDRNDGQKDYLLALSEVSVPTRVIAGSRDRLAPPKATKAAFDTLASTDKDFVVVGIKSGAPQEFDHLDLILGELAGEHVFPRVLDWLSREG